MKLKHFTLHTTDGEAYHFDNTDYKKLKLLKQLFDDLKPLFCSKHDKGKGL